jgi:hypothetical protein
VNKEAQLATMLTVGFMVALFGWALVYLASSPSHPNKNQRATASRFRRWLEHQKGPGASGLSDNSELTVFATSKRLLRIIIITSRVILGLSAIDTAQRTDQRARSAGIGLKILGLFGKGC